MARTIAGLAAAGVFFLILAGASAGAIHGIGMLTMPVIWMLVSTVVAVSSLSFAFGLIAALVYVSKRANSKHKTTGGVVDNDKH